jgi:ABC-type polysaccharide/polyol phosphate transport system ATPase subunit
MSMTTTTQPVAVELKDVSKAFKLLIQKPYLIHDVLRRVSGSKTHTEKFWALKNLTFSIRKGEAVGVVGGNGAGKSTLLGTIAGAITPTMGSVHVSGRLGALLELGAGFHPDLTGRENIYLNASLLGLEKHEIEEQFESVLNFSELHEFIDAPLRNYSSGMQVRLGFSVAIHIQPEILIMDEALSVGDQNFQQKCMDKILEFKAAGKTLLFVSHNGPQIQRLCERAIWLDHGTCRMDGPTDAVLTAYVAAMTKKA